MKLNIKNLAKKQGYTATELAEITNISRVTINKYFNSKPEVKQIDLEYLEKLCNTLGCTPNDILVPEVPFGKNKELRKKYLQTELELLELEEKNLLEKKEELQEKIKTLGD